MAAEPSEHEPPPSLQDRVARLEHRVDNVIPFKVDAVAYGLSVLHGEVREMHRTLDDHTLRLDDMSETLGDLKRVQGEHGEMLAEILKRLPPAPGDSGM